MERIFAVLAFENNLGAWPGGRSGGQPAGLAAFRLI